MQNHQKKTGLDWPVFIISGGILTLFIILSFIDVGFVSQAVNAGFNFAIKYFGAFWQILLLLTFFIALYIALSRYGKIRLGKIEKPEVGTFKWISMIMCTLLAGGGVFWAASEPIFHFINVPPMFGGVEPGTKEAVAPALIESFLNWGFLAWAILGALSSLVLMYAHYHKGQLMKPRALFYPLLGEKLNHHWLGTLTDAFSIIAVAAGTIGPIGFLGLQAAYGLHAIFGIPNNFTMQAVIIAAVVVIAGISAVTGINKGIQLLSRLNIILTVILIVMVLIVGPGGFIIDSFIPAFGKYIQNFLEISTYRGDSEWLSSWTVFFWGWFLGYGPMMAIFIARISKGRTVRELVFGVSVISAIVTNFWFNVVGGSGIFYELQNPGSVSNPLQSGGKPAAMVAITEQLPLSSIIVPGFLLVTILFVATTSDSMSYTISVSLTGKDNPSSLLRVFWALIMGVIAVILIGIGNGGIDALQSFIVIAAVPVSIILLAPLWGAPKVVKAMEAEKE